MRIQKEKHHKDTHMFNRIRTAFSTINNFSTLNNENNGATLCIQLRNQQTCTSYNHNEIKERFNFQPNFLQTCFNIDLHQHNTING
jgi:hypothetical protein